MTTVYIVCGAGASSTFLALGLRPIARSAGLSVTFVPAPLESIEPTAADVVAVAHHIALEPRVAELAVAGVTIALLPQSAHGAFGAEEAFESIHAALQHVPTDFASPTTVEAQA